MNPPKSGIRSTEFYLTVVVNLLIWLTQFGILPNATAETIGDGSEIANGAMVLASAVVTIVYALTRSFTKAKANTKSGYKTTEFWQSAVVSILMFAAANGWIGEAEASEAAEAGSYLVGVMALVGASLVPSFYTLGRFIANQPIAGTYREVPNE